MKEDGVIVLGGVYKIVRLFNLWPNERESNRKFYFKCLLEMIFVLYFLLRSVAYFVMLNMGKICNSLLDHDCVHNSSFEFYSNFNNIIL